MPSDMGNDDEFVGYENKKIMLNTVSDADGRRVCMPHPAVSWKPQSTLLLSEKFASTHRSCVGAHIIYSQ